MSEDRSNPPTGMLIQLHPAHRASSHKFIATVDTCEGDRDAVVADCHELADRLRNEGRKAAIDQVRESARKTLALADACEDEEVWRQLRDRAAGLAAAAGIIESGGLPKDGEL